MQLPEGIALACSLTVYTLSIGFDLIPVDRLSLPTTLPTVCPSALSPLPLTCDTIQTNKQAPARAQWPALARTHPNGLAYICTFPPVILALCSSVMQ